MDESSVATVSGPPITKQMSKQMGRWVNLDFPSLAKDEDDLV